MARADHLKRLLESHVAHDDSGFRDAAERLIAEHRRLGHHVVAEDLRAILLRQNGTVKPMPTKSFIPLQRTDAEPTDLLAVRPPRATFEELVLAPATQRLISRVVEEFRHRAALEAANLHPNRKLLFSGPPGCGKTITAEALAHDLGLPFAVTRIDSIVSSLLGETSTNLRRVFDYANANPCVLLLDEFDSIGKSRDDVHELGELKRVVNSFLQLLDSYHGRGVVIAATNHESLLDSALWRRFDEVIHFSPPTKSDIVQLLRLLLRGVAKSDVTPSRLAESMKGLSHAEVTAITRSVIKTMIISGKSDIGVDMFTVAIQQYRARRPRSVGNARQPSKSRKPQ